MINVGIVGGTGYTGAELLRLLVQHPEVEITLITSRKEAGVAVSELFPNLRHHTDLRFSAPETEALRQCDVIFFATPHAVSMQQVPAILAGGTKIIDLSADFRLKDAQLFSKWYGVEHQASEYLAEAVYGLPELNRQDIATARLVAAPGCYPTAVQLGFKPLLEAGLIDPEYLIADVKSGVSGAGREAKVSSLFAELNDSFKAYAMRGHRHQPEIEQELSKIAHTKVHCHFVPHLVPMIRGIEATLYAKLTQPAPDLQALYETAYANEYFIDVMPAGIAPETRSVRGSNMVRMTIERSVDGQAAIVSVVEDNLVKGASGQAVQCMNIMFGLSEQTGLTQLTALP